ncbi:MAG: PLP-dependent aminotransferase family protein [Desulfurococcaceae archaeon]
MDEVMVDYSKFYSKLAVNIKASEVRELLAIISKRKEVISFAGGIPDPNLLPKDELAEIARDVILRYGSIALQYSETKGVHEVRETLCGYLYKKKNINCDPEDVVITTGSQSALDLIARVFIDPGDLVITENPTYLAAIGAFKNAGAKLIGIPLDENGMKTDILEKKLEEMPKEQREKVKYIYTIPIAQNPAGVSMSLDRKKHLLEIASKYNLLVVEDDPYSYLVFDDNVDKTTLKSLDKENRVIYLGTASKILSPGLRIGWVISSSDIARKIELVKQYVDLHSPTLSQLILSEAIKQGVIDKVLAKAIPQYRSKRDTMLKAIKEYFPEYVWYSKPIGGLFVFAYIYKERFDAGLLLKKAIDEYKVAYVPGGSFHVDGLGRNSMRLNFSYPTYDQIYEGVQRLAKLIQET